MPLIPPVSGEFTRHLSPLSWDYILKQDVDLGPFDSTLIPGLDLCVWEAHHSVQHKREVGTRVR